MDLLQIREREIFNTLKELKGLKLVIIGGYAVNAYTLPRFSIDCDIVIKDDNELSKISSKLKALGYTRKSEKTELPYHGKFERFEKEIKTDFKVSVDILAGDVFDRQTNASFSSEWIFKNSSIKMLRGKTISEKLKIRIINADALFVMKAISCRASDIRDVFMLAPHLQNKEWIKEEVSKRHDFNDRLSKIREKINSKQFRDGLQGVFGLVDEKAFEKHRKALGFG